ncbi:hypothetical protein ACQ86E_21365 [Bradyrhizobium betae]|uniref:hypothetical protein n=1 Tax=Bradyrhizobium betae TaxID=244734 RepID=UPI003D6702AD
MHLMKTYPSAELPNIGTGEYLTIAGVVADILGYSGEISFDTSASGWQTAHARRQLSRQSGWRDTTPLSTA